MSVEAPCVIEMRRGDVVLSRTVIAQSMWQLALIPSLNGLISDVDPPFQAYRDGVLYARVYSATEWEMWNPDEVGPPDKVTDAIRDELT
jgi:hypothetical protein